MTEMEIGKPVLHLGADCYSVRGQVYYLSQIDIFRLKSQHAANDCLDILAHVCKSASDPADRIRAERKMGLIAKKWRPEITERPSNRATNRERQWLGMLRKIIATIEEHRAHCPPEVVGMAVRYHLAVEQTEVEGADAGVTISNPASSSDEALNQ